MDQDVINMPIIPDWMTPEQAKALQELYTRNADGSRNMRVFFERAVPYIGGYCGLKWCGMFIGIEKDGYTHS